MIGIWYVPSIYTYAMETSKSLAPTSVKVFFKLREYQDKV
jgi:hypothetical protein